MVVTRYAVLTSTYNTLNMNILENGLLYSDKRWGFSNVVSPFNRLYFVIGGDAFLKNGETVTHLEPGYVYLIPAGSRYDYGCDSFIEKFYLHFELQVLPSLDIFEGIDVPRRIPYKKETLDTILSLCGEEDIASVCLLKSIFYNVLSEFLILTYPKMEYKDVFSGYYRQSRVLSYIKDNLHSSLKISDISSALGVSERSLTKSFKVDTGTGLRAYITKMLLQRIKSLLLCTSLPIGEIAEQLQFCDAYYLSRFFKNAEGITPIQYRKKNLL